MLPSISASSVNGQEPAAQSFDSVAIAGCDRWQVFHRLQELDIPCQCGGFAPLQVQIKTPAEALQLWNIVRRVSGPRLALADSLQRCWQASK